MIEPVISGNKFSLNNGIYELIIVDRADEPNVVIFCKIGYY